MKYQFQNTRHPTDKGTMRIELVNPETKAVVNRFAYSVETGPDPLSLIMWVIGAIGIEPGEGGLADEIKQQLVLKCLTQ